MPTVKQIWERFNKKGEIVLKAEEQFQLDAYKRVFDSSKGFVGCLEKRGIDPKNIDGTVIAVSPELFEEAKEIAEQNSTYGWTLSGDMELLSYLAANLLIDSEGEDSQKQLDEYFYEYFSENDWEKYKILKADIINHIDPRWSEVMDDCFFSFENDLHKNSIPTLFTIIEGEIASTLHSNKIGDILIQQIAEEARKRTSKFETILLRSIFRCTCSGIFEDYDFKNFNNERKSLIKRNWVLHGRDNPKHWGKVDALRLFNILSSILFLQKNLSKELKRC